MNTTADSHFKESELQELADNLRNLENELMPQLEELDEKIPEIYSGYADLVRQTVSSALDIINFDGKSATRIAMGAEVFARGLAAFGQWKAAKKHNEMLDRILSVKKTIAGNNLNKIGRLRPEAERNNKRSEAMLMKYAVTDYDCSSANSEKLTRLSSIMLRALTLYRTSLFLLELSNYLKAEYNQWLTGKHTSGMEIPDYYTVNGIITKKLCGDNPYEVLERCADKSHNLNGAEIMLLSDYQLTLYALKDSLCTVELENASPAVRVLMGNNPGFKHYTNAVETVIGHVTKSPATWITIGWLATTVIVILLCIFYIPGSWWLRILIAVSGTIAAYKIFSKCGSKIMIAHCMQGAELMNNADETIEVHCGRIKRAEMDYERKNETTALISGFFNS